MSRHMYPLLVCRAHRHTTAGTPFPTHMIGECISFPNSPADRTYVLYDLFVTPAARGTGAGRALMVAAEAYARAHGAARLQLQTAVTNRVGQSLYESCGWKRDDLFYVYEKSLAG